MIERLTSTSQDNFCTYQLYKCLLNNKHDITRSLKHAIQNWFDKWNVSQISQQLDIFT